MTTTTAPEQIEAKARRLMADNADRDVRGWDGQRERNERISDIDAELDRWLAARLPNSHART